MNQQSPSSASTKQGNNRPEPGGNSPVTLIAIVIGVIAIGAVAYKAMHKDSTDSPTAQTEAAAQTDAAPKKSKVVEPREPTAGDTTAPSAPATPAPVVTPEPKAPVVGAAKDLVTSLASLDPKKGPITKEQAEKFKADLKALIAQGAAAVPAIREFLERNVELSYANAGGESLGYSSLRSSLIDALQQIGGPEATQALLGTLQTTALPSELAQLARALDTMQPGQYTAEIVAAARQTLDLAINGNLGKEDAGPLFDLLGKNLGNPPDPGLLNDLKRAAQNYKWYPMFVLANAGDAGIDAISAIATQPNAPSTAAEVLAQKAWENPKALDTLMQLARDNRISPAQWQQIVGLISGDEFLPQNQAKSQNNVNPNDCQFFHIEWNNQNFSKCKNPDFQPAKGIEAINKLLAVVTDPNVRSTLQQRLNVLQAGGR